MFDHSPTRLAGYSMTHRLAIAFRLLMVALLSPAASAEVVIHEIMANSSERLLRWSATGVPKLGYGSPWYAGLFDDSNWQSGNGPFGFGTFTNVSPTPVIGTNMATQMLNLTPTLYLRREFSATPADAANPNPLTLEVQFNDGFVCYLNGVEVARRNAGPVNGFVYHDQFAASGTPANTESSTTPYLRTQTISLGAANTRLQAGTNMLAIHALNYWEATVLHRVANNTTVTVDNLNNFYFKADLKIASPSPVTLVANHSAWKYLPGLVEPSGGIYDPTLLGAAKQNVRWGRASFDDAQWTPGAAPFGSGPTPNGVTLGTNLTSQLQAKATSLYLRTVFTVTEADLADPLALQLAMDWDDGFVAYLNGVEIARDRLAEANSFTPYDAVATSARTPGTYQTYNLDPPSRLLVAGQNVLAIQLHNVSLADADLFLRAQLSTNAAGTNHSLVAPTATWNYLIGTTEPLESEDENADDNPEAPDSAVDWIELHNKGPEPASLGNWKLSDDLANPAMWAFPANTTLASGEFLVVICDGKNLTEQGSGGFYHTNFKLDSDGETVVLSDAGAVVRQHVSFSGLPTFKSYGLNTDGAYVFFNGGALSNEKMLTEWNAMKAEFSPLIAPGYQLTLSHLNPDGTIYYTIDGSDPRAAGGVTRGTAYTAPIPINFWTTIKARVRRTSGEWSPLTEAIFDPGVTEPLLLTEIMYHPPDNGAIDGDNYEFLELKNPSAYPIQLGGMCFTSGISYTFPTGSYIGPGQWIVLARNKARFAEIYPTIVPLDEWGLDTALANSGESITLVNAAGRSIFSLSYADIPPWPIAPDGGSHSLVPIQADMNPNPSDPGSWRASSFAYGSPGMDDPVPTVPRILVSEILANAVAPEQDWIELHNPNDFPVDVGDWWLSDSDIAAQKYRIPAGTIIPPGGYRCITEADFAAGGVPFGLSRTGETARLSSGDFTGALTGYTHSIRFGASSPGESHGNYMNSQEVAFCVAQQTKTFGEPNGSPRNGPVVISELMHSPIAGGDEFLELCNVTDSPVDLFDPSRPTNGWKVDGIGWTFSGGITLQPRQVILVTQIAPATFRSK